MATNFQRITESPEKLAEFIYGIDRFYQSGEKDCQQCNLFGYCEKSKRDVLEWLQEERDDQRDERDGS